MILIEAKIVVPKSFHIMWTPGTGASSMMIDVTAKVEGQLSAGQVALVLGGVAKGLNTALQKAHKELKSGGFTVLHFTRVDPKYDTMLTQNRSRDMVVYGQATIMVTGASPSDAEKDKANKIVGNALADAGYKFSKKLPLEEAAMQMTKVSGTSMAAVMFAAGMDWLAELGQEITKGVKLVSTWDLTKDDTLTQVRATFDSELYSGAVVLKWDVEGGWRGKNVRVQMDIQSAKDERAYDTGQKEYAIQMLRKQVVRDVDAWFKKAADGIKRNVPQRRG